VQAGRLLRWARMHTGQSQQGLSAKTGIAQSTISDIEEGKSDPRFRTLRRLLRACGYDLELAPVRGYGVDRGALRMQLTLSPSDRVQRAAAAANSARAWRGTARGPGRRQTTGDTATDPQPARS
jgi:transcriptional regulator with XRE-family HTH domain